jgi:hypothetical protein
MKLGLADDLIAQVCDAFQLLLINVRVAIASQV